LALVWTLPDGSSVRASEVAFARPAADTQVTVEAIDRRGARSVERVAVAASAVSIAVAPAAAQPPPSTRMPRGCGCHIGTASGELPAGVVILSLGLAGLARTRRKRGRA